MTKKQFKYDFLRGLGSAIIELQTSDNPKKFSDIILYGCLHNTTYDMQCEGDRSWYLYYATKLAGVKETIEAAVIQKYFCVTEDIWLFDQLTAILYHYASNGSELAYAALYQQYENMLKELSPQKRKHNGTYPRRDMFDWLCVWLTSLDGWSAFTRIVRDISEILLPQDKDRFFSEWFYDNSKSKFGKKRVDDYLRKQAEQSALIRMYYDMARAWDAHVFPNRPAPTFEEVLAAADGQKYRGRGTAMTFARNAGPDEIEKLAQAAMDATNAKIQLELLWPFRRTAMYPFPEEFLAQLRETDNEELRYIAYDIIGRNPSQKTRELALSLIKSGEDIENGVTLLSKNLRSADEALFFDAVKTVPVSLNSQAWHGVFMAAVDGLNGMRGKPKTDVLEYLYRNTLCGSCREHIVRLMHKKKVLTEAILQECRFDANCDTRNFAQRIIKAKKIDISF